MTAGQGQGSGSRDITGSHVQTWGSTPSKARQGETEKYDRGPYPAGEAIWRFVPVSLRASGSVCANQTKKPKTENKINPHTGRDSSPAWSGSGSGSGSGNTVFDRVDGESVMLTYNLYWSRSKPSVSKHYM